VLKIEMGFFDEDEDGDEERVWVYLQFEGGSKMS